jgi:hypothetical protein
MAQKQRIGFDARKMTGDQFAVGTVAEVRHFGFDDRLIGTRLRIRYINHFNPTGFDNGN